METCDCSFKNGHLFPICKGRRKDNDEAGNEAKASNRARKTAEVTAGCGDGHCDTVNGLESLNRHDCRLGGLQEGGISVDS